MNQQNFGKIIFDLRQKKGLTQVELAEKCKLSLRTIQRIESDEVNPRSHTLKTILTVLDYDFETLSENLNIQNTVSSRSRFDQLKELFNLKKNTMKKVSVLSIIVIFTMAITVLTSNEANAQSIDGWFISGSKKESYEIGLDKSVYKSGGISAYLESNQTKIEGFGTLMQTCSAENYLGKRIKMIAYIKSENVVNKAGMWLRVDSKEPRKTLGFDNMKDRPIKGNINWTKYEIVLDVPQESDLLNFGVLINGTGKVWIDDIKFEIVGDAKTQKANESKSKIPTKPMNLDFSE